MMLEDFGIEAVPIPLTDDGIDLNAFEDVLKTGDDYVCLLYTSPSPRDRW